MLQRMIDDFTESTGAALRLTSLAAAAAVALLVTTSFLCAAAFVVVLERYGLVQACLAGAAVFFVVTLIAAGSYIVRKSRIEHESKARAKETARAALHTTLADPIVVAAGLQVIRTVGLKRLVPILAVAGLALGFLVSRQNAADQMPAE
jgi:archaellum biogenesis protein FlaJ (TadC family)